MPRKKKIVEELSPKEKQKNPHPLILQFEKLNTQVNRVINFLLAML